MSKKEKKLLWRILTAGIIFFLAIPIHYREYVAPALNWSFLELPVFGYIEFPLFLLSYIIIGSHIVVKALLNIKKGQIFDKKFYMSIATIGAC